MSLAANLARARKNKGLSQTALAKMAQVSQQLISRLESGVDQTTKMLPQIARVLGVHVYDLDPNFTPELTLDITAAQEERELLALFRQVPDHAQKTVLDILRNSPKPEDKPKP
jgi:transcriptional regulator with XRE-family HTH domain